MFLNLLVKAIGKPLSINLDGATILDGDAGGGHAEAELRIGQDGYVYKQEGGGAFQKIDTATGDWLRPVSAAPGDYQVKWEYVSGETSFTTQTAASGVWYALSSGNFDLYNDQDGDGTTTVTCDVSIRKGTGPTLTTGRYTVSAFVETG
jgi:hypothetical protein